MIPKAIRDRLGLTPGTLLGIEERGDVILLREARGRKRYTVDDLLALPKHVTGPPKSEAEIAEALDEETRRRWREE